ncbi:MAG: hypothetical protein P4L79_17440, partial [Legionella sp.]|uniref:hypothetical protein n=1 Tax=Legionella sp. TaxID=459 RepID=UPI00284DF926|nr:hypothetical protein [Legionella sp.]
MNLITIYHIDIERMHYTNMYPTRYTIAHMAYSVTILNQSSMPQGNAGVLGFWGFGVLGFW